MILQEIFSGLWTYREFIFYNVIIDMLAGIFLATALYPFLGKKLKERYNYALLVFFPSLFGAVFPDLMFILSSVVEKRSFEGIFYTLSHGGEVYSAFHFHLPIILVIPCVFFIIMIVNRLVKKKFASFPTGALSLACMLSLLAAFMHVFLGTVGF